MIRQIAVKVLLYISGAIMRLQCSTHLTITVVNLKTIKDIAFMITSELSWTIYCNMITARAYKQVGIRCRTFSINCMPGKTVLYTPLVRLQLLYCSQVWRPRLTQKSPT